MGNHDQNSKQQIDRRDRKEERPKMEYCPSQREKTLKHKHVKREKGGKKEKYLTKEKED